MIRNYSKLFIAFILIAVGSVNSFAGIKNAYNQFTNSEKYLLSAEVLYVFSTAYFVQKAVKAPTESDILKLNKLDINSFDRSACDNYSLKSADASDILLLVCAAAPELLAFDMDNESEALTHALMMIENLSLTMGTTNLLKGTVQRYRPFTYNENVPIDKKLNADAKTSFFSGHTSISFASMTFLAKTYQDYYPNSSYTPYVWAGSMLLASTVGYLRYDAGKHFPSDIIVGALVGSTIGYLVPELHKKNSVGQNLRIENFYAGYKISFSYKF